MIIKFVNILFSFSIFFPTDMELSDRRVSQTTRGSYGLNHLSSLRLPAHHFRIAWLRHQVLVTNNWPMCQHTWLDHQGGSHRCNSLSQGRQSENNLLLGRQDDQNLEHWDGWTIRHPQESLGWCHLSTVQWLLHIERFLWSHYKAMGLFGPLISTYLFQSLMNICFVKICYSYYSFVFACSVSVLLYSQ